MIYYSFEEMSGLAGTLDSLNTRAVSIAEALNSEQAHFAAFWQGQAHEEAVSYTTQCQTEIRHILDAQARFNAQVHAAIADMQQTEAANMASWA